jgi:hypothetical protein
MTKEKKPIENALYDSSLADAAYTQNNLLTLPDQLKKYLTDQGMDWRFLNATAFRANGGRHKSDWQALRVPPDVRIGLSAVTAEGHVIRGDLILGIRPKTISAKYKETLKERNRAYSNFGKTEATRMREEVKRKGLGEHVSISEGYDDDEKGFN